MDRLAIFSEYWCLICFCVGYVELCWKELPVSISALSKLAVEPRFAELPDVWNMFEFELWSTVNTVFWLHTVKGQTFLFIFFGCQRAKRRLILRLAHYPSLVPNETSLESPISLASSSIFTIVVAQAMVLLVTLAGVAATILVYRRC